VFGAFLRESAADKLMVFIAPSIFGGGLEAFGGPFSSRRRPPRLRNISLIRIGEDALLQGYLH
jgi:riboflavin biosynthesis pyrimidine reductase